LFNNDFAIPKIEKIGHSIPKIVKLESCTTSGVSKSWKKK
jgi:hypothetical protein